MYSTSKEIQQASGHGAETIIMTTITTTTNTAVATKQKMKLMGCEDDMLWVYE